MIKANLNQIRERIQAACERVVRDAEEVTLIAITKYAQKDWVQSLLELGMTDLGESRPQQLAERFEIFNQQQIHWHLIGHLQRNKARRVLPLVAWIHSVDSLRLLQSLERLAAELSLKPKVLLEVNVSHEVSKDGFAVEQLLQDWEAIIQQEHLQVAGLMTMAPLTENVADTRPVFTRLRELREQLQKQSPPAIQLSELSMGMSRDFEVAIEEGATMIRIGRSLFEGLD